MLGSDVTTLLAILEDLPENKREEVCSDQIIFKNSVGVAAAKKSPVFGYYLNRIHTRKDTRFDYQNIELLNQIVQDFILHI